MKKVYKILFLFTVGFITYCGIELLWRGYTYPLMGVCGGIAILLLDQINNKISWNVDILFQGTLGSLLITIFEYIIGTLSIKGILPKMWDYSNMPLNYKGIICLPFSLAWLALSIGAIMLADAINYYILGEDEIPYYKLFGRTILRFKEK